MDKHEQGLLTVICLGALLGLGQVLASGDRISIRYAIGRAIVSAGIATSSYSVLAWMPNTSPVALVGIAALLASLGTSGLTLLAQRLFQTRVSAGFDQTPNEPSE